MYGIDLGTTNSLIGDGESYLSGLVKSSVDLSKMRQDDNLKNPDIYLSYKKSMTIGKNGEMPQKASSVILKHLVDMANTELGRNDYDVVISVPAKFSDLQRRAVREAAALANLNVKGIINEPTAAAVLACKRNPAALFVIDIGGGTTDISIVDSGSSTCEVYGTDGLLIGGDDLDDEIYKIICAERKPLVIDINKYRIDMKINICKAKEEFTENVKEVIVDCSPLRVPDFILTEEIYLQAIKNVFQKTLVIAISLLNECKGISKSDLEILFVGGTTKSHILRNYFLSALGMNEYPYQEDRDTAVAQGVALCAKLMSEGKFEEIVRDTAHRLFIANDHSSKELIRRGTFLPAESEVVITNEYQTDKLEIWFYQGNNIDTNDPGTEELGLMTYTYDRVMNPKEGSVLLKVCEDRDSVLHISVQDLITGVEQNMEIVI